MTPSEPKAVPVYRARNTPWTNDAHVGKSTGLLLFPRLGQRLPVNQVDHFGPQQVVSVQLGRIEQIISSDTAHNADLRAVIEWGNGGIRHELECDWSNGVVLSMVADSVTVSAYGYAVLDDTPYAPQNQVALIAAFGEYPRGGALPPTWTSPIATLGEPVLGVPESVEIQIPRHARRVSVQAGVVAAGGTDPYALLETAVGFTGFTPPIDVYRRFPSTVAPIDLIGQRQARVKLTNGNAFPIYASTVFELGL